MSAPGHRPYDAPMPASPPLRPPLLEAIGLRFSRDDEPVFGPLDLSVDTGEALLVRGGNGAGKTTLLRVLAGLLRADAGTVQIEGRPASPSERAGRIGYVGHLAGLKGDLSADENLQYLGGLAGVRTGVTIADALGTVGLAGYGRALARQLSAGQRKRLSLARLWRSPCPLWLLDEPYANLDLDGIELVNRLIEHHLHTGGAALLTTHGAYAAPPVRTRLIELDEWT